MSFTAIHVQCETNSNQNFALRSDTHLIQEDLWKQKTREQEKDMLNQEKAKTVYDSSYRLY